MYRIGILRLCSRRISSTSRYLSARETSSKRCSVARPNFSGRFGTSSGWLMARRMASIAVFASVSTTTPRALRRLFTSRMLGAKCMSTIFAAILRLSSSGSGDRMLPDRAPASTCPTRDFRIRFPISEPYGVVNVSPCTSTSGGRPSSFRAARSSWRRLQAVRMTCAAQPGTCDGDSRLCAFSSGTSQTSGAGMSRSASTSATSSTCWAVNQILGRIPRSRIPW